MRQSSRTVGVAALLALLAAAPASPQQKPESPSQEPGIDARKLPLNFERLKREIRESVEEPPEFTNSLLRYRIDVFGQSPRIQIFTPEDNLRFAPAPYGAPTHQEMMDLWTPREFRSPVMDFSNLLRWLMAQRKGGTEK